MSMTGTRVLVGHSRAAEAAVQEWSAMPPEQRPGFGEFVAEAVLTAHDGKTKWVVATSEGVAFGPYATHAAAMKALQGGHLATRHGTKAMVLPLQAAPRSRKPSVLVQPADGEQLTFEFETGDDQQ